MQEAELRTEEGAEADSPSVEIPAAFYWSLWCPAFAVILWFMLRFFGPPRFRED